MRRRLALMVAIALAIAGLSQIPTSTTHRPVSPPPAAQRVIDGFAWAVTSPGTEPHRTGECAPAQAHACQQILEGIVSIVVVILANGVVAFVTPQ